MINKKILIFGCVLLAACNNHEVNNEEASSRDTVVQLNNEHEPSVWKKEVISNYDQQFPNLYYYDIKWSKEDSVILYRVRSKYKDTLVPVELEHLTVKAKNTSFEVDFINKGYKQNLPKLSYDFSDIDKNIAGDIHISTDTSYLKRSPEEAKSYRDSMATVLFK